MSLLKHERSVPLSMDGAANLLGDWPSRNAEAGLGVDDFSLQFLWCFPNLSYDLVGFAPKITALLDCSEGL